MRRHARLFNALTVVMLGLTVVVLGYYVLILLNPYTPLNPFPPATRVALLLLPSATPTSEGVAAPPHVDAVQHADGHPDAPADPHVNADPHTNATSHLHAAPDGHLHPAPNPCALSVQLLHRISDAVLRL